MLIDRESDIANQVDAEREEEDEAPAVGVG